MPEIMERMLRAARLDAGLIDDLEGDPGSLRQGLLVAALSAAAGGLGAATTHGLVVLPLMAVALSVAWLLYAALVWVAGTRLLPEPSTHAEYGEVVRALGFAMAPGMLHVFSFLPMVGVLASPVGNLWSLAASAVLLRRVLSFTGWGRVIAVLVIGALLAYGLVFAGLMLTPAGLLLSGRTGGA